MIQNLNVLDYDYYFRIISHILKGDASNTLLIINEIIDNGFDGQHFIIGLGEHLRNLLVCKDPATSKLLEVSDNLKKKYLDQSGLCDTDFLLRALSINNQYDVQYKSSNNKQLLLELSLLQMCGLMGFAKAKQNPADKKINELPSPDTRPAPPVAANTPKETKTASPKPEKTKEPEELKEPEKKYELEEDVLNENLSIKKASKILNSDGPKKKEAEKEPEKKNKSPFTQEELNAVWKKGIPSLCSHSQNLLSCLMANSPELKEELNIDITADNKVIEREVKSILPNIMGFLKKELDNDFITLNIVLADIKKQQDKAYFPDEIYKKMTEKNPEIKNLRDQLDLEIDF